MQVKTTRWSNWNFFTYQSMLYVMFCRCQYNNSWNISKTYLNHLALLNFTQTPCIGFSCSCASAPFLSDFFGRRDGDLMPDLVAARKRTNELFRIRDLFRRSVWSALLSRSPSAIPTDSTIARWAKRDFNVACLFQRSFHNLNFSSNISLFICNLMHPDGGSVVPCMLYFSREM